MKISGSEISYICNFAVSTDFGLAAKNKGFAESTPIRKNKIFRAKTMLILSRIEFTKKKRESDPVQA